MEIRCRDVIKIIEKHFPVSLAESWDKNRIGFQVGNYDKPVKKVFFALDLMPEVLAEARAWGADLVLVHHSPLFEPAKRILNDSLQGKVLLEAIRADIAIYAAHTNLDVGLGGVNDVLAELLGLTDVETLAVSGNESFLKLVTFIPEGYEDKVRDALADAGAGWIGNYSHCTFQTAGQGTFLPRENTDPFIGAQGELSRVKEYRLETILPSRIARKVLEALEDAHPYEEIAYDLYPLANAGDKYGLGRSGLLPQELTLRGFIELVSEVLVVPQLRFIGNPEQRIKKVSLCGGSGMTLAAQALEAGSDVFLTGDIKYHEAQEYLYAGLSMVDAGHFYTENPVVERWERMLREELITLGIKTKVSKINTDPFNYYSR